MNALGSFWIVVRRDPLLIVCGLFVITVVLLALVGIHFTGYDYDSISKDSLTGPSAAHWFGTDVNGRDLLTRTLYGAQISLLVAACGTIVSLTIGVAYGMISGYAGGRVDNAMMRLVEIAYSLPTLVLVIVVVTTLDAPTYVLVHGFASGVHNLCLFVGMQEGRAPLPSIDSALDVPPRMVLIIGFLGLTEWFTMARIIRGQVLVLKEQPFIQASQALGQSHRRILWQHLLPNLAGVIIVYLTLTVPAIMLDESFMSFLGVGVPAPMASWGTLVSDAAGQINPIDLYWWLLVFPGLFMSLTLLSLNFLGDGLRDALDPRVKK